jgi:hypothetical protein
MKQVREDRYTQLIDLDLSHNYNGIHYLISQTGPRI